jgi:hypothetical protein
MFPLYAQIALDRLRADTACRTPEVLDQLITGYASHYAMPVSDDERARIHQEAARRFPGFEVNRVAG